MYRELNVDKFCALGLLRGNEQGAAAIGGHEAMGVATEVGTPAAAMMITAPPAWADVFLPHPASSREPIVWG